MARLILFREGQKLAVDLRDGTYVVGREPGADIVIPDPTVSSRHAELRIAGDTCTVRDLGSSNGTLVNGTAIRGTHSVTPSDEIIFGAAMVAVEFARKPAASMDDSAPTRKITRSQPALEKLPQISDASIETNLPAVQKKKKTRWTVSLWLAGAGAIAALVLLMLFVEMYSQAEMTRTHTASRYSILAAQYMHLLRQTPVPPLPTPVHDQWLTDPIFVLDRDGKVLYPPQTPGAEETPSPLIDAKTGKVEPKAKNGLYRFSMPAASGPIRMASFPVTYGGDLLGFVIAQPVAGFTNLPLIALMIVCAAAIALFVLYFAIRPVTNDVRADLQSMREKLSAVAHGFVPELPRSARMPELSDFAAEVQQLVKTLGRGQGGGAAAGAREENAYAALTPALLDSSQIPYCFISSDFHLLFASREIASIQELASVRQGTSIFDAGMTNVQSKQVVRAITDARTGGHGQAETSITRKGEPRRCIVHVRRLSDALRGDAVFGMLFEIPKEA